MLPNFFFIPTIVYVLRCYIYTIFLVPQHTLVCMYHSIGPTFHTIKEFQGRTTLESYLKKKIENWVLYLEHISLLSRKTLIPFELEIELVKCCQKYILDKDTISSRFFFTPTTCYQLDGAYFFATSSWFDLTYS